MNRRGERDDRVARRSPLDRYAIYFVAACLTSIPAIVMGGATVESVPVGALAHGPKLVCSRSERPHENDKLLGIALAGPAFAPGTIPGRYGADFIYPDEQSLDYYARKGFRLIRLTFLWERLQPVLFGPFDGAELDRLTRFVRLAADRKLALVIGPHNYARYTVSGKPELIGTKAVPTAAFQDFWSRLALAFKAEQHTLAFTLMNEPHDTNGTWREVAQAGLNGIRSTGSDRTVYVPGDGWSGAWTWDQFNDDLILHDPQDHLVYEAHQYFDQNSSGFYKAPFAGSGADRMTGVRRVQPFLSWLARHRLRGAVTEYGIPNDDPRWLAVLDQFLAHLASAGVSGTYWAGGPWWGDYPLSVEPRNGQDAPAMSILEKYADPCPHPPP